jgi:hypothetical protein
VTISFWHHPVLDGRLCVVSLHAGLLHLHDRGLPVDLSLRSPNRANMAFFVDAMLCHKPSFEPTLTIPTGYRYRDQYSG